MNLPSGHKRINSAVNQFSGQKVNPRGTVVTTPFQSSGAKNSNSKESFIVNKIPNVSSASKNAKGSILFHNLPLKLEGELSISKTASRDASRGHQAPNSTLLNRNGENRSFTPNKSNSNQSSKGFGIKPMRPSTGNNFNIQLNKIKKLDTASANAQNSKSLNKKTKSYYIPKSARDNLNLSSVSGNKTRFNEHNNNSFHITDLINKSKFTSYNRTTGLSNITARSSTPNQKSTTTRSNKLGDTKYNKSNTDLNKLGKKMNISKSPNNNVSRLSKKIQSVTKISASHSPNSRVGTNPPSRNPFDTTLIKQMNDFKNNKSPTPNILKKMNNTNNTKPLGLGAKFGGGIPNVKRVITGNLINMNMNINNNMNNNNTNDLSTNSTFISKDANSNNNNNVTNNSNVGMGATNNLMRNDNLKNSPNVNRVNNLAKERDSKGQVDFREITTSPLLRKKPETFSENNNEEINSNIIKGVSNSSANANISFNNLNMVNPVNQISNKDKVVRKTIKLIHEYSKVGYSGPGVKKTNQDNYFVFKNFVGNPNHYYMSVCDGHGILGHEVSGYLRENLPVNLSNLLKFKNKNVLIHNVNSIIEDVFLDLNHKLHSNEIIDTTFSGSTCVSLIFTPEKVITANVGDSRAVLGRCVNGEWISHNLTRDHKPNEKDESIRIKKRGGRIEPFKDEDGEFIGPHRVWLKEDDIPGLAMSRSFGDKVASSVGVVAEPEIFEYKFQEEDKFFIIASDGVWEFIESPECINIIKDYYLRNDILGCCEYIYRESSNRWMKEEEVIDDTTMIIVFLD